ncbi:hypothetical protein PABG_05274 [Paracoccidioides brasiliensis Pb03]|nr:hypothetical protein PABG_05274 [Paracoccidioides brasiliensis Pb03]
MSKCIARPDILSLMACEMRIPAKCKRVEGQFRTKENPNRSVSYLTPHPPNPELPQEGKKRRRKEKRGKQPCATKPTSCTTAVTEAGGPSSAVETDTSAPLKTPSTTPLKSTTPAASVGLAAAMLRLPLLVLQHLLLRLPTRPVDAVDVEDRVLESQLAGLILDCAGEVSGKLFTGGY